MKNLKIFILVYTITFLGLSALNAQMVEIIPDSIVNSADFVERGLYDVYKNDTLISSHSKPIKAAFKSNLLKQETPGATIEVRPPIGQPTGELKIFVDQSKLTTNTINLDSVFGLINNLKEALTFQASVINDLYIIEIPKLQQEIKYIRQLDSTKFRVLENQVATVQTFIRDSIAFINESVDYTLPIIKGFSYDTTGWLIDVENDSYKYLDQATNRYIVFEFNRDLKVGETYRISFDIASNGNSHFSIWLYNVDTDTYPQGWTNPNISNELIYPAGSHYYDYTVEYLDRKSLGFRAKDTGWGFTMSNIKIEKL